MALIIIIALCNLVTLVSPGHNWSQLVTSVTVKVRDLNNDVHDVYLWTLWPLIGNCPEEEESEKINASLLDLLASPQVIIR